MLPEPYWQDREKGLDLYCGDCAEVMLQFPAGSVGLVVTSPPYGSLKDYGVEGQIGFGQEYHDYLRSMRDVLAGCYRVLAPGCRAAVNIGDEYCQGAKGERYHIRPTAAHLTEAGLQVGFRFLGAILWLKVSTTHTTGGCSLMGSMYYPKDGQVTYEHEYILLFRKPGDWPKPTVEAKEQSRLTKRQRSEWFRGTWRIPPARIDGHPAPFPLELPERLIRMYSFYGETVLDPFAGSGTTLAACAKTGRRGVGIDLNESYCELAARLLGDLERQLRTEGPSLFNQETP